ncbi:hypothetical protein DITRI_Ditri08aG0114000 [Diplodiscus trichospermus]
MVESEIKYEQLRKRRLEENKKRIEELNLRNLFQALKNGSPKSSPGKPRTPRQRLELTAVRRSSRVADKPKPNYRGYSRRNLLNRVYASDKERAYAIERAKQLESSLGSDYPSFVKPMRESHVTGFWLGLPVHFCKKHLPDHDEVIILVDEEGDEFATKYLGDKNGLRGSIKKKKEKIGLGSGWRGFSIDHNLVDGDALVFQLVAPAEFKVYITRAYELEDNANGEDGDEDGKEPDVEPDVQVTDTSAKRTLSREEPKICGKTRDKPLEIYGMYENRISVGKTGKFLENMSWEESTERTLEEVLAVDISEKSVQKNEPTVHSSNLVPTANQCENDTVDRGFEVLDQIRPSERIVEFKEVKNFEDFNIIVDGLVMDSELSEYMQTKYYNLCCSQKSALHENLLEGLNCKLVAGAIAETINIADAIRAAKLTTSHHSFLTWDQTLKSFEGLGMKVGFLRFRLNQLMKLSMKSRRYQEARLERINANEERMKLEAKLVEVTEALTKLDAEIGSLEAENADRL